MFWKRKKLDGIFDRILLSLIFCLHLGAFPLEQLTKAFTPLAHQAVIAVVHIRTDSSKSSKDGSGFFISNHGHIVTNAHLVHDAHQLQVTTYPQQTYLATLVHLDPESDLAVIKIEGTNFPFLRFGNSHELEIGELVIGIGYTIANNPSLSLALINALHVQQTLLSFSRRFYSDSSSHPLREFWWTSLKRKRGSRRVSYGHSIRRKWQLHWYQLCSFQSLYQRISFKIKITLTNYRLDP